MYASVCMCAHTHMYFERHKNVEIKGKIYDRG